MIWRKSGEVFFCLVILLAPFSSAVLTIGGAHQAFALPFQVDFNV